MSTYHVLVSQPLMAAGSSSRFPRKPLEGGLTCGPLSYPQFRRPTSGPDVPRLSHEPVCAPVVRSDPGLVTGPRSATSLGPLPRSRGVGPGGGA